MLGDEIKKQIDDEYKKFHTMRRALEEQIKILESEHNQTINLIQKQCGSLTGHKDNGGFMYGSCVYCGIFGG